ncbi:methyltransferase [Nonomuraea zeae]|uniref:methyltransferase n=1 Tax=Nonomuraea zeae TaxID=1642303 RepID=UPI0026CDE6AD
MQSIIDGFTMYTVLRAALQLSIIDLLAAAPRTLDDLAGAVAAATDLGRPDERLLARLMRALRHLGLVDLDVGGRYRLTADGEPLISDRDDSLAPAALIWGTDLWRDSAHLLHLTIARGVPVALDTYEVSSPYAYLHSRPAEGRLFNEFMRTRSHSVADALAAQDLSRFGSVADIGGGTGIVLARLLQRNPGLRGTLFELPEVAAEARQHLGELGLDAVTVVEGDMFADPLPPAELLLLCNVVHNYDDERAVKLLARVAELMTAGAELWIVDSIVEDDPVSSPTSGVALDVKMLTLFASGQERTLGDIGTLLGEAGLAVVRTGLLPHGLSLLVARPG